MGDGQNGNPGFLLPYDQVGDQFIAQRTVEAREGFIEQQCVDAPRHGCPRQMDALSLASGKLRGPALQQMIDAE